MALDEMRQASDATKRSSVPPRCSRCARSPSATDRCWRTTTSRSRCTPGRSTPSSARTARASRRCSGIAAGTVAADSGIVEIDGRPLTTASAKAAMQLGVGMAYQTMTEVIGLTVAENLFLAAPSGRRPKYGRMEPWAAGTLAEYGLDISPGRPDGEPVVGPAADARGRPGAAVAAEGAAARRADNGARPQRRRAAARPHPDARPVRHRRRVRQPPPPGGAHRRQPPHRPARRREPGHVRRRGHVRGRRRQADDRPPARPRLPRAGRGSERRAAAPDHPTSRPSVRAGRPAARPR